MINYKSFIFLSCFCFLVTNVSLMLGCSEINGLLAHKNSGLEQYLNFIGQNLEEKIGILPHILAKRSGTFLEVGAGGDSISYLLSKIPNSTPVKIIATDIDPDIVKAIPQRNPQVAKYIGAVCGPQLEFHQLDATNMENFADKSIDGINASALVHEIISYAGLKGRDNFFHEVSRVLVDNGVLVYRDPEGVPLDKENVTMVIQSKNMRLFVNIFLPKLLDYMYTRHANKPHYYDSKMISVQLVLNGYSKKRTKLSGENFIKRPTSTINFNKPFIMVLPRGLAKEIERHYLTFLHQCNPLEFVKVTFISSPIAGFKVDYCAPEIKGKFMQYLNERHIDFDNDRLTQNEVSQLKRFCLNRIKYVEQGVRLYCKGAQTVKAIKNFLNACVGNNFTSYIMEDSTETINLDYKVFALLYESIKELFIDKGLVKISDAAEEEAAKYLKREGEEHYFYASPDEFITYVGKTSLEKNGKNLTMLAPFDLKANRFIPRPEYQEFLARCLMTKNSSGCHIKAHEGKRIIDFKKMKAARALQVYREIVASESQSYPQLAQFIKELNSTLIKGL